MKKRNSKPKQLNIKLLKAFLKEVKDELVSDNDNKKHKN
jgi:hypothetical protein|tara:strand:+ start:945 stop:1061 length:117 start_codon:yes stop_codon:yes gene_type:complete